MSEARPSLADTPPVGLDQFAQMLKVRDRVKREADRDAHYAGRGERLALLTAGKPVAEVWARDLLPLLTRMYDTAEERVTPGTPDAEKLGLIYYKQALRDFVELIGGEIQMGRGALRRIAMRKFGAREDAGG